MSAPKWLQEYYGKDLTKFSPTVFMDGQRVAVLRITKSDVPSGFSKVAFVLVQKRGRFGSTPQKSLHEGTATGVDVERMDKVFQAEDDKL